MRSIHSRSRRSESSGLHAIVLAVLLACLAQAALGLDYIDSTPAGAEFPQWDGGNTELEFADIDADGHVDFLSIGDHGSPFINTDQHGIMAYFGDGQGGWSIHMEGNFGYGGIAVGDANNDGHLDVGYGMHHDYSATDFGDQLLEVALGDGTGTNWIPWDDGLATNGEDWGMFASDFADLDADGDLDIASNSFGCCNGLHVYLNHGDGSWSPTWSRTGGNAQPHLVCGDVNGDGLPDIAASYQYGAVWLNDGEGGFVQADVGLPPSGGSGLRGVSLGDIDLDGRADLAFTLSGVPHAYVWRTDHWEPAETGLPAAGDYEVARLWDLDLDGFVDLAAMGEGLCSVWLGDSAGQWMESGSFDVGPAVDTAAFNTGGDVDHNGYPDFALVQEEGSWPNYRNYLYVYRESSVAATRFVSLQYPRGNETFLLGSVQTLRWSAAQVGDRPAAIDLELSTTGPFGPWTPIASGLPDGGAYQWNVAGETASTAHLRVTLTQDGESVAAVSRAFSIVPSLNTAVPTAGSAAARSARLRVLDNPARGSVRFSLEWIGALGYAGDAKLVIYSPAGRRLCQLPIDGKTLSWDLRDREGRRVPAGVYLARLELDQGGLCRRFIVLR